MESGQLIGLLVLTLAGLNVGQFLFWSKQNQKLVDKLMSRNYAEYRQADSVASQAPPEKTEIIEAHEHEDFRPLHGIGM